ncbi:hypothetical protein [Cognatilysobacter bugurensis]|uniref:hypothetical protein n=1 Tax=Cognatilysobacter bugurensis TaxID=543356 RepID=UPI00167B5D69|nr:hypothetical protein [Lysobacter bugurensis]
MLHRRLAFAFAAALLALPTAVFAAGAFTSPNAYPTDATVEYDSVDRTVRVRGPIGPRFEPQLRAVLAAHPDAQRVDVRSPGGMRRQALRAAELLNERQLPVRITGRCASACALLWAAVDAREMTAGSRLGLHRSRLVGPLVFPDAIAQQINAHNDRETDAVLRKAGFPEHVVVAGSATPSNSMSWFAADELQREGVPFVLHAPLRGVAPTIVAVQATVADEPSGVTQQ